MNTRLIGPLMGIVFIILAIVAAIVGGTTPDANDSVQKVVSFYTDHGSDQQWAGAIFAVGGVAFLFFLGTLRQALRAAAGDEGFLSTMALLGGLMITVGISIFAGIGFTLGDAADDIPAAATQALNALNSDMFFTVAIGTIVFNLGLALAVLRHGGLPRPLGWVALVLGIAGFLGPIGFFAFVATGIVIIWASVWLAMEASAPETSATTT